MDQHRRSSNNCSWWVEIPSVLDEIDQGILEFNKKYLSIKDHDIVVIGYPGQLDVLLARILCWFRHKPLVWDIFMSIYLISIERKLRNKNKLSVGLLRILEWISCRIPDFLILDTKEYVEWFVNNYHIGEEGLN